MDAVKIIKSNDKKGMKTMEVKASESIKNGCKFGCEDCMKQVPYFWQCPFCEAGVNDYRYCCHHCYVSPTSGMLRCVNCKENETNKNEAIPTTIISPIKLTSVVADKGKCIYNSECRPGTKCSDGCHKGCTCSFQHTCEFYCNDCIKNAALSARCGTCGQLGSSRTISSSRNNFSCCDGCQLNPRVS